MGLSGSSAIVIAALRALGDWLGLELQPDQLAEAALACEVDELGITAGPMDRVIQAYEGLLAMDFAPPRAAASYRRLDPSGLPPLFLAWNPRGGAPSRRQHGDVRARWLRGDTEVRAVVAELARLADSGIALHRAAAIPPGSLRLFDENFALRARVYPVPDVDRELVSLAREAGAAAKMCGSGGAVIGALRDEADWPRLAEAYAAAGYAAQRAHIALPAPGGSA